MYGTSLRMYVWTFNPILRRVRYGLVEGIFVECKLCTARRSRTRDEELGGEPGGVFWREWERGETTPSSILDVKVRRSIYWRRRTNAAGIAFPCDKTYIGTLFMHVHSLICWSSWIFVKTNIQYEGGARLLGKIRGSLGQPLIFFFFLYRKLFLYNILFIEKLIQ